MRAHVVTSTIHGFPRIGPHRELKTATEAFWAGKVSPAELLGAARSVRNETLRFLVAEGIELVPTNDFSLYDHVLDTAVLVGARPPRYAADGLNELDAYFAMARGIQRDGLDLPALEMTKWFDTNYHYIVPELTPDALFSVASDKPVEEATEALAIGATTKTVLVGPVSFLLLAKPPAGSPPFDRLKLLDPLLDVYAEVLARLAAAGVGWVQLDEPVFALDRGAPELDALAHAVDTLAATANRPRLLVATYFDRAGDALNVLLDSAADGIGLDLCRGGEDLETLEGAGGAGDKALAAGVVDGRNVWANDLERSLATLSRVADLTPELHVSTSCSLQHVPVSAGAETALDPEVRSWLAFAREKVREVAVLTRGVRDGHDAVAESLASSRARRDNRAASSRAVNNAVRRRMASLTDADLARAPYPERAAAQQARLGLPLLPTTTIGSYPQTPSLRRARRDLARGRLDRAAYETRMKAEIARVVALQEEIGLDVLVHGEPERNDMVQYFAEQLDGYAVTENGWVQSYGTRYTRPPIVYGDVSRPHTMTVDWIRHAQSLTTRPVKGMLTGPITMLQWSFPRDDQPERETARQIALAIRDEVADLDAAGVAIVQVDEPAIREGLPLRGEKRRAYLDWAVESFRLATAVARPETQVHTHMCYSEFGEILDAIADLDADVASIEAARSRMDLLEGFARGRYPRPLGPGVYDIHSPRVPAADEMADLLRRAVAVVGADRLWVNPDCGLKTRDYAEVEPALRRLVAAARLVREEVSAGR